MAARPTIASIVEGHGETYALPVLVRRIAGELFGVWDPDIAKPHRLPRDRMVKASEMNRAVILQGARVTGRGGILVLADADDDCAVELSERIRVAAGGSPVYIAVAVREFEVWFLSSLTSLRGHRAVRDDAQFVGDAEAVRGAKEALRERMLEPYSETLHQPAFAGCFALDQAMRSRSFRHFVGCVGRLLDLPAQDVDAVVALRR